MSPSFHFARRRTSWAGVGIFLVGGLFAASACNGDDNTGATSDAGAGGGGGSDAACLPNSGPIVATVADMHCVEADGGKIIQAAETCPSGGADASTEPLPGPRDGNEGDDDDCKYHVKFSNSCVSRNTPVTFTVTLTSRTDNSFVGGATTRIEGILNNTTPIANPPPVTTEASTGVYRITGVIFPAAGTWLVRFHFFETCDDTEEDSKHGHAAFNIVVP